MHSLDHAARLLVMLLSRCYSIQLSLQAKLLVIVAFY